jgi:hypothetical protein
VLELTRDEFLAKAALILAAPFVPLPKVAPLVSKRVEIDLSTLRVTKELGPVLTADSLRRGWLEASYLLGPDGEKYVALPRFDE